ncbi:hypothetical protein [Chamaesiphon minutus]|uniref:Uncharacterized protein n=1 Tax=Chamaesiphon minutus (strain ATCC 27169 / PCC 6605) TaxID=1173020 RepID=K9UHN5_CHAP6|nr:hypothetical protein [Chamaesiphon minutus]AFY94627.1 hypothetical protein Cha6605_3645 [Chamaesiphon minutus PCC 6605]
MSLFPLDGSLDWNLVSREELTTNDLGVIPPRIYTLSSSNIVIGTGINVGSPNWKWAGRLIQIVPAKPSTTGIFAPEIEVSRTSLYIGRYQHFRLADYSPRPYKIRFEPARWLVDLTVEIWRYDET